MTRPRQAAALVLGITLGIGLGRATLAAARSGQTPSDPTPADAVADSLVGLWIDSVGGPTTFDRLQSASYTVTTILYDTLSGRVRRSRPRYVWIRKTPTGHQVRVERWEPHGFIAQGFDGTSAWATLDGTLLPDTAKDHREVRYVAGDLFYWPGLPFKLRDPGVFLHYRGRQPRPGAEFRPIPSQPERPPQPYRYHDVEVTFGESVGEKQDTWHYYFAPGRGTPTEVTYREEGRTSISRVVWGPTVRVGNLRYPIVTRRDWITASGKRTKALTVDDVVINPALDNARFSPPDP